MDQTLKGIQSSEDQKSLEFINFEHRKKKSNEDSKEERTLKIINIDQILTSEETLVNLMTQQAMILLKKHDYTISQPIDYTSNTFVKLEQNFIDLMTQHRIQQIYSVHNVRSLEEFVLSKEPNAISVKLLS